MGAHSLHHKGMPTQPLNKTAERTEGAGRSGGGRDRLIEVAATHFAEHGLQGASQRAIQREVGVNPGAANYYFGSKEALYQAVIEDALQRIQTKRQAGLEMVAPHDPTEHRLRQLLRGYLAPHIQEAGTERGYSYVRILAALHLTVPDSAAELIETYVHPVREKYVDELSKIFPSASRNRIYEVLRLAVGLMAMSPVRSGTRVLSDKKIRSMIEDVVEIGALSFESLCDIRED